MEYSFDAPNLVSDEFQIKPFGVTEFDISLPIRSNDDFNEPNQVLEDPKKDEKIEEVLEQDVKQPLPVKRGNQNDRQRLINDMRRLKFTEDEINYYDKLAGKESGWRANATASGTHKSGKTFNARGYFQFLDSTLKDLGINKTADEMTREEQLMAIKKFTDRNRKLLANEIGEAKTKGLSEWGLLGGAHLGGVGGVRRFLKSGQNAKDKFGTSVGDYIKHFS